MLICQNVVPYQAFVAVVDIKVVGLYSLLYHIFVPSLSRIQPCFCVFLAFTLFPDSSYLYGTNCLSR